MKRLNTQLDGLGAGGVDTGTAFGVHDPFLQTVPRVWSFYFGAKDGDGVHRIGFLPSIVRCTTRRDGSFVEPKKNLHARLKEWSQWVWVRNEAISDFLANRGNVCLTPKVGERTRRNTYARDVNQEYIKSVDSVRDALPSELALSLLASALTLGQME